MRGGRTNYMGGMCDFTHAAFYLPAAFLTASWIMASDFRSRWASVLGYATDFHICPVREEGQGTAIST